MEFNMIYRRHGIAKPDPGVSGRVHLQLPKSGLNAVPEPVQIQPKVSAGSLYGSFLAIGFAILLTILAVRALRPPDPVGANAPATDFSAERALIHVSVIARVPHPIGSSANDGVRQYLVNQLSALGLHPEVFHAIGIRNSPGRIAVGDVRDVVGRLPGSANTRAVMLVAHYDSVYRAPGAADDGASAAAILEALRALRAGPALKNDLIVLFTDGEEQGLLGAEAFANSHPWMKDVGLVLNFEARGDRGPSLLFETSPGNGWLLDAVSGASPKTIGSSLFYALYKLLPNDTDFTVFRRHQIPGLNFAFGENLEAYHSRLDNIQNLSAASVQHHGSYVLNLARRFGQMNLAQPGRTGDEDVFFDWFGGSLIAYREHWIIPGEVLGTLLLIFALGLTVRRNGTPMGRILLALLPSMLLLLAIPACLAVAWWLVRQLLAGQLLAADSRANLFLLSGFVLFGAFLAHLLFVQCRKMFSFQELCFSGLIILCLLSWTVAILLPAGSYLLFWPFFIVTAGQLAMASARNRAPAIRIVSAYLGIAITILLFAPLAYLLYVFLTLQVITAIATGLLLALAFILCVPFVELAVPQHQWRPVTITLLCCAVTCLAIGIKLSHYSQEHPRRDSVLYSLNADDGKAAWVSYDQSLDRWTRQFFQSQQPQLDPAPNFLAGSSWPVLAAPATHLDIAPPVAEIKADEKLGDTRSIHVTIRSARNAEMVRLIFDKDTQPMSIKIGNRDVACKSDSDPLTLTLLGMESEGADLEIKFPGSSRISFWLIDQSFGLPLPANPRPPESMAREGSDVTIVSRRYSL